MRGARLRPAGSLLARAAVLASCALASAGPAAGGTPHVDYMLQCQGCHLADGSGSPGAVPSFRDFVGRFTTVPGGRDYLVRVPGSAQSPLSDAELAAVLNWMVREFGPEEVAVDFVPFSADEIVRLRTPPLTDVEGVRRELVSRVESQRDAARR